MEIKRQIRLYNRDITKQDIELIKELIQTEGLKGRTYISKHPSIQNYKRT